MVLLALALGCGLVASIGISQVMDRSGTVEIQQGEMVPILVAGREIHYNEQITPDLVRIAEWPKGQVPAGAITKLDELQGRHAATPLVADEPILTSKLIGADGLGAARQIPKGYRVVSVQVDAVTGASSLIMPGDRVDVVAVFAQRAAPATIAARGRSCMTSACSPSIPRWSAVTARKMARPMPRPWRSC